MTRQVNITGIFINSKLIGCAHSCRYCSISIKHVNRLPLGRFATLVDGLIEWRARSRPHFDLYPAINHCYEMDAGTIAGYMALRARAGSPIDMITTGGLRQRSDAEIRDWLAEWRAHGIRCLHASFAGHGAVHDRWNGRRGDFLWLTRLLQLAGTLGFELGQSLFLTKSTLPLLPELIVMLDAMAGTVRHRRIFPLGYTGLAVNHEPDRITESIRDALPAPVAKFCWQGAGSWRSERQWIEHIRSDQERPRDVVLKLEVTDANIASLEARPWDDIMTDLEHRTRAAYAAVPSTRTLCDQVGDPDSRLVYVNRHEIERLWLWRYLKRSPIAFEGHLTDMLGDQ